MDTNDIIWRLAQLASLPFQERYVIDGTVDEYVLDTELLENVDGLKYQIRRPENINILNAEQSRALEDLIAYIENHSDQALSGKSREECALLIRESNVWRDMRNMANNALQTFGICVDLMSASEIDQLALG